MGRYRPVGWVQYLLYNLQIAHLVLLVYTTPAVVAIAAVAAGLDPPSPSVDGNVDSPVASSINPCPPMADLAADVDAVPTNQPTLAFRNLQPPPDFIHNRVPAASVPKKWSRISSITNLV